MISVWTLHPRDCHPVQQPLLTEHPYDILTKIFFVAPGRTWHGNIIVPPIIPRDVKFVRSGDVIPRSQWYAVIDTLRLFSFSLRTLVAKVQALFGILMAL